jgi:homoserine O-acetyltransferase/O-succinyltransferase
MSESSTTSGRSKRPRRNVGDDPQSPHSVGFTEAKHIQLATPAEPFVLEAGGKIGPVTVEYETYGKLSPAKDNVILIVHALSGCAHAAGWDRHASTNGRLWRTKGPGWWDPMIGPGKPIDTDRFFVICPNFLGSCYGTTGPSSINPATGKPYGLSFPVVTVGDWVRLQARLLDALGIERVRCVVGGSLGGQQALEWALAYPERIDLAMVLAASPRLSSQGLAFNTVGRQAIMSDPNFHKGDYYELIPPNHGLAVARMMAHITYLSEEGMHEKFGRRLQDKEKPDFGFGVEFEVESYLDYQGRSFVERFDANSYLYITRAMDYYDAAARWGGGDLVEACKRIQSQVMAVSFSTDWLYTPAQVYEFSLAMCRAGKPVTYVDVPSRFGHDAFLVETDPVGRLLLHGLADRR